MAYNLFRLNSGEKMFPRVKPLDRELLSQGEPGCGKALKI